MNTRLAPLGLRIMALVLGCMANATLAAGTLKPFSENSLDEIIRHYAGRPFLLVLWSVDCAPCAKELDLLAATLVQHPQTNIAFVSTDGLDLAGEVESVLKRHRLDNADNWLFTDANSARLRYYIDEQWFGELPRSYFYTDAATRLPYSGTLTKSQLDRWLSSIDKEQLLQ